MPYDTAPSLHRFKGILEGEDRAMHKAQAQPQLRNVLNQLSEDDLKNFSQYYQGGNLAPMLDEVLSANDPRAEILRKNNDVSRILDKLNHQGLDDFSDIWKREYFSCTGMINKDNN